MPGIAIAGGVFVFTVVSYAMRGDPLIGYDAHAYYQAAALDDPYRTTINGGFDAVGGLYEYKYPPVLAQVLHPIRMLGISWPAFLGGWTILLLLSLGWMGRKWTLLLLLFPPVLGELWLGNLNILLGLAIVVGMRYPASWSFILLTKITPGVGLIWFAVRREWRSLAIALGATVAIVGVSFVLAPWLWSDFIEASRTQVDATVNVPAPGGARSPCRSGSWSRRCSSPGPRAPTAPGSCPIAAGLGRPVPVVERLRGDGRGGPAVCLAAGRREGVAGARRGARADPRRTPADALSRAREPGPAVAGHRHRPARPRRPPRSVAGGRPRLPGPGGRRDPADRGDPRERRLDVHDRGHAVDRPAVAGPGPARARLSRGRLGAARRGPRGAPRADPRAHGRLVDGARRRTSRGGGPRAARVRPGRPGAGPAAAAVRRRDLRRAPVARGDAPGPPGPPVAAPVLVVLWANMHGSFVLAPLVLGYAWLDDVARGRPSRTSLAVLVVSSRRHARSTRSGRRCGRTPRGSAPTRPSPSASPSGSARRRSPCPGRCSTCPRSARCS